MDGRAKSAAKRAATRRRSVQIARLFGYSGAMLFSRQYFIHSKNEGKRA
jgi:hypothetical protein